MKKILIFIGPPGSGKGTQAKILAKKINYDHISTGDLFRALSAEKNIAADEKHALEEMKAGKLVPDWLVYRIAFKEIKKYLNNNQGVILDGAIRNAEQAEEFQKFFTDNNWNNEILAVEVALSDEESYNRLTKRRMCGRCGEILPWLPTTKDLKVCPKCGGELVLRKDDNEEVIQKRIADQGNIALKPILDFYKNSGVLKSVDGAKSIEEVTQAIEKKL